MAMPCTADDGHVMHGSGLRSDGAAQPEGVEDGGVELRLATASPTRYSSTALGVGPRRLRPAAQQVRHVDLAYVDRLRREAS